MKTVLILSAKDQIEQLMKSLISASEKLEIQQLLLTSEELTLVVASTQSAVHCPWERQALPARNIRKRAA